MVDRKAKRFVMRWHEDACIYCGQCVQVRRFMIHLPPDEWELAATGRGLYKDFREQDDIKQAMDALRTQRLSAYAKPKHVIDAPSAPR